MLDFCPQMDLSFSNHLWMEIHEENDDESSPQRMLFGDNIRRLMRSRPSLDSNPKLSVRADVGVATLSRIITCKTAATLDTVARLAEAFGLEPWQLLVPNLNVNNPQMLQVSSPEEIQLWERLREVISHQAVAAQDLGSRKSEYTPKGIVPHSPIPKKDKKNKGGTA